ncbi:MAG: response regulator [Myxococcota bacterium]
MSLASIDLGAEGDAAPPSLPASSVVFETAYRCEDGVVFPVSVRLSATHLDGAPATLLVFHDISHKREVERKYDAIVGRASRFRKAIVDLTKHGAMRSGDFAMAAAGLTEITSLALETRRASVWLLSQDATRLECVDLYDRRTDTHSVGATLRADDAPAYFQAIASGRALDAHDSRTDPRTSEFLDYMMASDIVGLLDAPIRVAGEVVGVVCHEQVGRPRRWRDEEVDFAGEVADQAALALLAAERRRAEEAHRGLEREMQRARHFESLGALAGGLAHDFNNLLMAIIGSAGLAMPHAEPESRMRRHLLRIEDAAQRAAELTSQMLAYAGKGRVFAEPIELGDFMAELKSALASTMVDAGRLRFDPPSAPILISGDREQLARVLVALVGNASEALSAGGGEVLLRVQAFDLAGTRPPVERVGAELAHGTYAVIDICDDGCGLDPAIRPRVFDPFFTTKRARRGLGLPSALGIVRAHGGAIELHSRAGGGTMVRVYLPAIDVEPARKRAVAAAEPSTQTRSGAVLVVDDESAVREVATAILEDAGYPVLQARDGLEAVEAVREHGEEISAVLLDLCMPRLDGLGALRQIRVLRPELPVLLQSGYHEDDTIAEIVARGEAEFLEKPYGAAVLIERVRRVLNG